MRARGDFLLKRRECAVKRAVLTALLLMAALLLSGCRFAVVESGETVIVAPAATDATKM